jgi:hypothetical protein
MDKAVDNFHGVVCDLTMDEISLSDYIQTHDIKAILVDMTSEMEHLKKEVSDVNANPADVRTSVGFFGISCMCLFERSLRDLAEYENKEKAEFVTFAKMLRKQLQIVDRQDVEYKDIEMFMNCHMTNILDVMNEGNSAKTNNEVGQYEE